MRFNNESDDLLARLVSFNPTPYQVQVCQAVMKENTVTLLPNTNDSHYLSALVCQVYARKFHTAQIIYVTRRAQSFRKFQSGFKKSNLIVSTPEEIKWHEIKLQQIHLVVFDHVEMEDQTSKCFAEFKTVYRQLNKSVDRPRIFGMFTQWPSEDWRLCSSDDLAYRVLKLASNLDCSVFVSISHPIHSNMSEFYGKCLTAFKSVSRRQDFSPKLFHNVPPKSLLNQPGSLNLSGNLLNIHLHRSTTSQVLEKIGFKNRLGVHVGRDELVDNSAKIITYYLRKYEIESSNVAELLDYMSNLLQDYISISIPDWEWTSFNKREIQLGSIEFGNLMSSVEFCPGASRIESRYSRIFMSINRKFQEIQVVYDGGDRVIKIPFDSVDNMICIDPVSSAQFYEIYVPLKRVPMLCKKDIEDGKTVCKRVVQLDDEPHKKFQTECLTLKIQVKRNWKEEEEEDEMHEFISSLAKIEGVNVYFTSMTRTKLTYGFDQLRADFQRLKPNFEWQYLLEVFLSQCDYALYGKLSSSSLTLLKSAELPMSSLQNFENFIDLLINRVKRNRYFGLNKILDTTIAQFKKDANDVVISCLYRFDDNLKIQKIRTAVVTPTRIIYELPSLSYSNRLTREYTPDKFLRVRFRDENRDNLSNSSYIRQDCLFRRVYRFLLSGCYIQNRYYEYLASSSSQLRDHGVWMIWDDGKVDAYLIRARMGDFSKIKNVGKYAARLGQALSSSLPTIEIEKSRMNLIPDIKDLNGKYMFTDGVGAISEQKEREISTKYYNGKHISAFQIRMGGFKGVVAVNKNLSKYDLVLRESMKKFDSDHNVIEVLNISDYQPCYLNRQIIMILSCLGISDETFIEKQNQSLKDCKEILTDNQMAISCLKRSLRQSVFAVTNDTPLSHNLNSDAFFRSILERLYNKSLNGLIWKSKIFIPKGRLLMGCIDETGSLKGDQVFIQIARHPGDMFEPIGVKHTSKNYFVITSQCIVAKNPCMHPGDLRKVKAVYCEALEHLVDVIVFPSVGTRPITSMCSGSDLDGDLYWVSWDPSLIPTYTEKPMSYFVDPRSDQKETVEDITIPDVIKFTVDFMQNNNLGIISNLHTALADQSKAGVADEQCLRLAQLFSQAVDFPKTGKIVEVPEDIRRSLTRGFPDFMGKSKSYESDKVIGCMYRECKEVQNEPKRLDRHVKLEKKLLLQGYQGFIDEAGHVYRLYCEAIEYIVDKWNCGDEIELFIGKRKGNNQSKDEIYEINRLIQMQIKLLWEKMRSDYFFAKDGQGIKLSKTSLLKKASAWYYVAYTARRERDELKVLSFPWIVAQQLCEVYQLNTEPIENCAFALSVNIINTVQEVNWNEFSIKFLKKFIEETKCREFKWRLEEIAEEFDEEFESYWQIAYLMANCVKNPHLVPVMYAIDYFNQELYDSVGDTFDYLVVSEYALRYFIENDYLKEVVPFDKKVLGAMIKQIDLNKTSDELATLAHNWATRQLIQVNKFVAKKEFDEYYDSVGPMILGYFEYYAFTPGKEVLDPTECSEYSTKPMYADHDLPPITSCMCEQHFTRVSNLLSDESLDIDFIWERAKYGYIQVMRPSLYLSLAS